MKIHFVPDKVSFSLFTTEQIKKMCVTQIITPLMLDPLGHPLQGGLYDSRLGPYSDKDTLCGSCNKTFTNCPGHFGYIELPLPVVNPLFHKIIGTIIKISCLSCYHIQIPTHIKKVLCIQIKLLNCGLITEAVLVESSISELIAKYEKFENIPAESINSVLKFEELADETLKNLGGKYITSQNTETLRNQFVAKMLKDVTSRQICIFCKSRINRIQALKNRIILTSRKGELDESNAVMGQKVTGMESKYITPEESRQYLRNIWKEETEFLQHFVSVLSNIDCEYPTDAFYFEVIPVPPPNVRPVNFLNGRVLENKQSTGYKNIIQNVILLKTIIQVVQSKNDINSLSSVEAKTAYNFARGNSPIEKLNYCWEELQSDVNGILDHEQTLGAEGQGLKQIIEKKEGVIRMCMMGKRVNFSARSVITPDPNLNIDEIGIPEVFAKKLTYPVAVTPWNVEELRKMVLNGPNVHPGAVMIEYDGILKRINPNSEQQQKSLLKCLLTPEDSKGQKGQGIRIVHRHLCNGDVLLLNRQPTLHKPSIMAHTARILKGEKTLRLHYANCKAYNADFDGDEMNAHFPQNELARSEGYNIVNVSNQYLVPKDGTPLSGLIQDHMISGVRLSLRGRFFNKQDYEQLVYQALSYKTGRIKLLPPTIIKPQVLWSGKQILSTVIINVIPEERELINLTSTAKISPKAWQKRHPRAWRAGGTIFPNDKVMSEAEVIIRGGELLVGILDKTHYGSTPYGLVHCIYELYGGTCATRLLSSLAKLFMRFLQQEGFTLGVHDILTVKRADIRRRDIIKDSRQIGKEAVTKALDLPLDTPDAEIVETIEKLSAVDPKIRTTIDRSYKSSMDGFTNEINRTCLPAGLVCKFPENNLQLMVQSGAKGSTVNTMQISCLLGQIELEGKRPPVMISGKSLPSFPAFEFTPRAGGFIDGRFMTGIQPQEFFFHCMAGREGLIDTAVKTSRSGYLQRCLIKHLEGLRVGYDMTVRNSDKSVIQFLYGEDGMDISKAQFFNEKQVNFLAENMKVMDDSNTLKQLKNEDQKDVKQHGKMISEWKKQHGDPLDHRRRSPFSLFATYVQNRAGDRKILSKEQLMKLWYELDEDIKISFITQCKRCPDPIESVYQPDANFGAINEKVEKLIKKYKGFENKSTKKEFQDVIKLKVMQSMCSAGEPVGLLAAQSIGEPSTQMTLNTFHFAGRGEMNVTLGIPRLREILMMASQNIKTPSMEIPFLQVPDLEYKSNELRKLLTRVVVSDVLETIDVTVELQLKPIRQYKYTLKFKFLPKKYYSMDYCVNPTRILKHMKKKYFGEMFAAIKKFSKINSNIVMMEEERNKKIATNNDEDGEGQTEGNRGEEIQIDSSDDEVEDQEDAKQGHKYQETRDDLEPEEEEKDKSDDEDDENDDKTLVQQGETENPVPDNEVVDSYNFAQSYYEDQQKQLWCEITFGLPLTFKKLDLTAILKETAGKSVLWETPQIKRAITYVKDDQLMLRTDGINIVEMFKYNTLLDLPRLYCNDIHKVAETYGIEAASKVIVKEVKDVFNVYGIKVDPRHLSLVADYMTFNGTFEPLSRRGMENSASPLQQMSFESSLVFLRNAAIRGREDDLQNPSSSLMLGKPCGTGTGSFTLLHKSFVTC